MEFPDGAIKQYVASTISQNMYSHIDADGYSLTLLDSIIGYTNNYKAVIKDENT